MEKPKERKEIRKNQFEAFLQSADHTPSHYIVTEPLTTSWFQCHGLQNCEIHSLTLVDGAFRNTKTVFKECIIGELIFEQFVGHDFEIDGGSYKKIVIKLNASKNQPIQWMGLKIKNVHTPFELEIKGVPITGSFELSNCKAVECINISNFALGKCLIVSSSVQKMVVSQLTINETTLTGSFKDFIAIKTAFKGRLVLADTQSAGRIIFSSCTIAAIDIRSRCKLNLLAFRRKTIGSFIFSSERIARLMILHVTISSVVALQGKEDLPKIVVTEFVFFPGLESDVNAHGFSIRTEHLDCKTLQIQNLFNRKQFTISNTKVTNRFAIDSSNFRSYDKESVTAEFKNFDLQECKSVSLFNSNIIGSKFFNVRWNSSYQLDKITPLIGCKSDDERIDRLWTLKESYRQLKIVSTENSNKIDSNNFQVGELDTYYEILRLKKKSWQLFSDYVILWVSKNLGGYGMNIIKPIRTWLFLHSVLFMFIRCTNDLPFEFIGFDLSRFNWDATSKAITFYVTLMSPIHDVEFWNENIFGLPDTFIRIVSGFFIYYIIRASRKFIS